MVRNGQAKLDIRVKCPSGIWICVYIRNTRVFRNLKTKTGKIIQNDDNRKMGLTSQKSNKILFKAKSIKFSTK